MAAGRRLVLDANILVRAVLANQVKRIITDHAEEAEFFAPEVAYADAERYLPQILTKHDRADEIDDALAFLAQLRAVVLSVPDLDRGPGLLRAGVPTWTTDRVELYLDARGAGD